MVYGEIRLTRKPVVVSPDIEIIDQWALEVILPRAPGDGPAAAPPFGWGLGPNSGAAKKKEGVKKESPIP